MYFCTLCPSIGPKVRSRQTLDRLPLVSNFLTNFWMQHFDGARLSANSFRNAVWLTLNEHVCQYLRKRNPRCSTVYIDNSLGPLARDSLCIMFGGSLLLSSLLAFFSSSVICDFSMSYSFKFGLQNVSLHNISKQPTSCSSMLIKIQPDATVCRYLFTAKLQRGPIGPHWREVAVPVLWPVPEAAVTVFSTPDDGCCDTRKM